MLGDVVTAFQDLQAQGKVKYYGITAVGDTAALREVIDSGALYTAQVCYNLLNECRATGACGFPNQDFGQLIDRAASKRMGCIGIRVLAAGALSGVMERHPIAVPSVAPIGTGVDYQADVQLAQALRFLTAEGHADSLVEASMRLPGASRRCRRPSWLAILASNISSKPLGQRRERALPAAAIRRLEQAWAAFPAPRV